jgi:hypothetical protein
MYFRKCESGIYILPAIFIQTIVSSGENKRTLYFTFLKYELAIFLN